MKRSVVFMDHFGDTANEEDHLECVYFAEPIQIDEIKILPNHSSIQLKQRSFFGYASAILIETHLTNLFAKSDNFSQTNISKNYFKFGNLYQK